MGRNLTNLPISASFQYLTQISGSELTDGLGADIDSLNIDITGTAATASVVNTDDGSALSGIHYIPFVDVRDSDGQKLFTDAQLQYNPATDTIEANLEGTASFATTASFALNAGASNLQEVLDAGPSATGSIDLDGAITASGDITTEGELRVAEGAGYRDYEGQAITTNLAGQNFLINGGTAGSKVSIQGGANSSKIVVNAADDIIELSGSVEADSGITAPSFTGSLQGNADSATEVALTNTNTNSNFGIPLVDSTDAGSNTGLLLTQDNSLLFNPSTKVFTFDDGADIEVGGDVNITGNITASNASFESASIGFLQSITGSAKIIGDAFIILNSDTPTERYAGIKVYDSGSTLATGSLQFDSQTNDWFYEYEDDDGTNFGGVMFGPEYATKGSPTYPAANTILKGNGGHHVEESSITDDGTLVDIDANVSASGYVSASAFIGDGSALTNLPASDPFPYNGDVVITGSAIIGGVNNSDTSTGEYNVILNDSGSISGTTSYSFIAGCGSEDVATISNGIRNSIISSRGGTITGGARNSTIIAGLSNTINANSNVRQAAIIASRTSQITGGSTYGQAILGAQNATLSGNGAVILGGGSGGGCTNSGTNSVVLGGYSNTVSQNHSIVSGRQNDITGGQIQTIMGGLGNDITSTEATNGIFSGKFATIDGTSENSVVIGGVSGDITSHDRAVVLGGNGLTTTKDDEVILKHLNVQGNVVQKVNTITVASNTGSLDASLGSLFEITLGNGVDTQLEIENQVAGQTLQLKITNNATSAGTISFDSQFEFEGGTAFEATAATNAVDILTLTTFDGTSVQCVGAKNFS